MRSIILTLLLAITGALAWAQEDMPVMWEQKLDHKILHHGTGAESVGFSYAASDKEMSVLKNADGTVIWTKSFKDIAPALRKVDELIPVWESRLIFLFERKTGKDQIACIDMETGQMLWNTDKFQNLTYDMVMYIPEEDAFVIAQKKELYFVKARTGEQLWSTTKFRGAVGKYVFNPDDKSLVMVNFVPSGLGALFSGYKNQIARVDATNGNIIWENTYIGRAEREIWTKKFVYDLKVASNKVLLEMNGMQVYDYNTGKSLWSAAFDFVPALINKPMGEVIKFDSYHTVADPVIVGNDIYILDLSQRRNMVLKKFNLDNGILRWISEKIWPAEVIPNMYVIDDKVILQIGGRVETQYLEKVKRGAGMVNEWGRSYPQVMPYGLLAFNTSDGKIAWKADKFKRGITNILKMDDNLIACSGKELYSIDIQTGEQKYVVPVKDGGVGQAALIQPFGDNRIVVVGARGVSKFNVADGALICNEKYKTSDLEDRKGDILIMKTANADIAAYDLNNCSYKEFKAKSDAATDLSDDGRFVYVYEKKTVTRLRTN